MPVRSVQPCHSRFAIEANLLHGACHQRTADSARWTAHGGQRTAQIGLAHAAKSQIDSVDRTGAGGSFSSPAKV